MTFTKATRFLLLAFVVGSLARANIIYTFSDPGGVGFQYTQYGFLTGSYNQKFTVYPLSLDSSTPSPSGYIITKISFFPGGGGGGLTNEVRIEIDEENLSLFTSGGVVYLFPAGSMGADGDYAALFSGGGVPFSMGELRVDGSPSPIPEPGSLLLVSTTLISLLFIRTPRAQFCNANGPTDCPCDVHSHRASSARSSKCTCV
jgi:hypothetical protein